jgi:Radical SAM superfamily
VRVHLVNPSDLSFGIAVITPRWLYVLAAATPARFGAPRVVDETLDPFDPWTVAPGDVVGIGIHTGNALRGYAVGRAARARGARVVFGGIHATLFPDEAREHGGAHAVVTGDGDIVWPQVLADGEAGTLLPSYDGGRIPGGAFTAARWDLLPDGRYMWGSIQTVRGCPKHCSFCSVWRTDGQTPRQRPVVEVVREAIALRRKGFRFVLLADDNFYPVTLADLAAAARRADPARLEALQALRRERFALMAALERLPVDMVFFTQITMEAAEDPEFLTAMRRARIRGALVGVESVTAEGLKAVYKDFNLTGDALVTRLQAFRTHGVQVLGSFIFGLPTDTADTFAATAELAGRSGVSFAQFVMLTPFPGTVDFAKWEQQPPSASAVGGVPLTRYWLIPPVQRPKVYAAHPTMSAEAIRQGTQMAWDRFYTLPAICRRSTCVRSLRARLAFVLISKLYRQMYANTGIATDSARVQRSARRARWLARAARRLFVAAPMPELADPPAAQTPLAHPLAVSIGVGRRAAASR